MHFLTFYHIVKIKYLKIYQIMIIFENELRKRKRLIFLKKVKNKSFDMFTIYKYK